MSVENPTNIPDSANDVVDSLVDGVQEKGKGILHEFLKGAKDWLEENQNFPFAKEILSLFDSTREKTSALSDEVEGNYDALAGLKGEELWDNPVFQKALQQTAKNIGTTITALKEVFFKESKNDPSAVNTTSGASGLIQFMPFTAKSLGTNIESIRKMSAIDQLKYVEKYYKLNGKGFSLKTSEDLYLTTFHPASVGKPDDAIIGLPDGDPRISEVNPSASKIFDQNPAIAKYAKNEGYITVGDFKDYVKGKKPSKQQEVKFA